MNLVERRIYPVPIERRIDIELLADLSEEEADAGEEDGLQGNQQYRDIRGITWDQLAEALQRETELFQRFAGAALHASAYFGADRKPKPGLGGSTARSPVMFSVLPETCALFRACPDQCRCI